MNQRSDIDRVLEVWMADGPTAIPDRVVDVVAARIGVQRQRRAWPFPGRTTVTTPIKLIAGLAAALVVAVVGYSFLPRATGSGGPSATPTPAALPSAAASDAPSPSATFTYPTSGILAPGQHATKFFVQPFTFTVPNGWILDGDTAAFVSIFPDIAANRAEWARTGSAAQSILIADLDSPYYRCDAWEDNQGATAAEMLAKVMANKALTTTGVVDVEIGGLTGKQFDVRLDPDWKETCPGDPPGTDLPEWRTRSILLDRPGGGVIVFFIGTTHAADFEAHLASVMPAIASIEFKLGQ